MKVPSIQHIWQIQFLNFEIDAVGAQIGAEVTKQDYQVSSIQKTVAELELTIQSTKVLQIIVVLLKTPFQRRM